MEEVIVQEIERKKKSLKRYKRNCDCIERLEEKLFMLDERLKSVRSPNISGMPRSTNHVSREELLSDKIDLEERIKRLKEKNRNLKSEILNEIDSLDDPRYCEVLESFFIDRLTIEEIADVNGYTIRHTYRLYLEGIKLLSLNCHKQDIT